MVFASVFRGKPHKRRLVPKDTLSWGSRARLPPRRGNPIIGGTQKSLGDPAKTLLLLKSCRLVPPHARDTPGRSRETFDGTANFGTFFTSQGYLQLAPLVRVDGSRKLPQITLVKVPFYRLKDIVVHES